MLSCFVKLRPGSLYETVKGYWDEKQQRDYFFGGFCKRSARMVEINGKIAGCYSLSEEEDHLYLQRMYIHPDVQSRGLGSRILAHAIETASARKKPLDLEVLRSNEKAFNFYKKKGFYVLKVLKLGYRMRLADA